MKEFELIYKLATLPKNQFVSYLKQLEDKELDILCNSCFPSSNKETIKKCLCRRYHYYQSLFVAISSICLCFALNNQIAQDGQSDESD